jgi:tRNA(fMet)-specific endonuclease VapC
MILLDTDTLTLFLAGNERVRRELERAEDEIAITVVTRIEVLQGRFDFVLKAADGVQLREAMQRLEQSEQALDAFTVVSIDDAAAEEFDRLRQNKRLKKIGRADLLIASIALGRRACLVTRNLRHFQLVPGLQVANWAG